MSAPVMDALLTELAQLADQSLAVLGIETAAGLPPVALDDLPAIAATPITKKAKARPKKPKKEKREGFLLIPAEPLARSGACPGGRYLYVDDVATAVPLLTHWAQARAWAAIDLETGLARRYRKNEETGEPEGYLEAIPDPHASPIFLCSVSVEPGVAVVFDLRRLQPEAAFTTAFVRFLRQARLVAHNAAFESSFFLAQFGEAGHFVYDTMVAHQLATAGLSSESSGLDALMKKYQGRALDKQWQTWFIKIHPDSALVNEAIAYSAADVCQLLPLMQQVHATLKQSGQLPIWTNIEKPFLPWLVAARVRGVAIDRAHFERLDEELARLSGQAHGEFRQIAGDSVLITSWQQLTAWFATHGVELASTNETTLTKVREGQPPGTVVRQAIESVLAFRDAHKQRSTYIQPYLTSLLCPLTGRIHPSWKQASTATGRMACSDPNLQNIPSRGPAARLRAGIVAEPGQRLVWCDYSQFEVRALADAAHEIRMIRVFQEGKQVGEQLAAYCRQHELPGHVAELAEKDTEAFHRICVLHPRVKALVEQLASCDFHRRTAALLFKKDISQITKAERTQAKTVTFGVPYGAGPPAIAEQAGISLEEAEQLLNDYYRAFPAVKRFLDVCQMQAVKGKTATAAGRLRFYELPNQRALFEHAQALYEAGQTDPAAAKLWAALAARWFAKTPQRVAEKQYRSQLGKIKREGSNQPIQGINADATKLATVLAGPRLKALDPRCDIIMWVHDEIVMTAPEGLHEAAGRILQDAMIEAALRFLKRCPVETSLAYGQCWGK